MNAGLVIDVQAPESVEDRPAVRVVAEEDLQSRYHQMVALLLRMGSWLSSPEAQLLPEDAWESLFEQYQEQLEEVRRMGDELRPVTLRQRNQPLTGDALVGEVMELFAA